MKLPVRAWDKITPSLTFLSLTSFQSDGNQALFATFFFSQNISKYYFSLFLYYSICILSIQWKGLKTMKHANKEAESVLWEVKWWKVTAFKLFKCSTLSIKSASSPSLPSPCFCYTLPSNKKNFTIAFFLVGKSNFQRVNYLFLILQTSCLFCKEESLSRVGNTVILYCRYWRHCLIDMDTYDTDALKFCAIMRIESIPFPGQDQ